MPQQPPPHHPLIRRACECECVPRAPDEEADEMRELALLIRQGLKLIVVGIEKKYGLDDKKSKAA